MAVGQSLVTVFEFHDGDVLKYCAQAKDRVLTWTRIGGDWFSNDPVMTVTSTDKEVMTIIGEMPLPEFVFIPKRRNKWRG